jgi:hypothetical protein
MAPALHRAAIPPGRRIVDGHLQHSCLGVIPGSHQIANQMAYNEIRVPTCRSEATACPEGQGCAAAAAALASYPLGTALHCLPALEAGASGGASRNEAAARERDAPPRKRRRRLVPHSVPTNAVWSFRKADKHVVRGGVQPPGGEPHPLSRQTLPCSVLPLLGASSRPTRSFPVGPAAGDSLLQRRSHVLALRRPPAPQAPSHRAQSDPALDV